MSTLGIDIGGSGIKGCLVNVENGQMETLRFRLETPEGAKPDEMARVVQEVVQHFEYKGPVGYGFPSVVLSGVVYTAANIHKSWVGMDAAGLFKEFTSCPAYVLNDADAAGIAEMKFGVGKDYPKGVVLMLTLGTGIGTALFVDGRLVPNLEFGHLEIRGKDAESRASDAARQRKELTWENWAERLQEYLSRMEGLMWPDVVVLGGGVSKEWRKFLPFLKLRAKILPAQLLNQAGMIGAALYADEKANEKS
jgi:polyphosphate glucokinase